MRVESEDFSAEVQSGMAFVDPRPMSKDEIALFNTEGIVPRFWGEAMMYVEAIPGMIAVLEALQQEIECSKERN